MKTVIDTKKLDQFVAKAKDIEKGHALDLSSDEDLSIAVMNLISIEEHLFFTAKKTNNNTYFDLLFEIREMRKTLLKQLIKDYEGEVWCTSKHLLAASMRLMEVGTKALATDQDKAYQLFDQSYNLFNLFWALNLKLIDKKSASNLTASQKATLTEINADHEVAPDVVPQATSTKTVQGGLWQKFGQALNKALDCCRE